MKRKGKKKVNFRKVFIAFAFLITIILGFILLFNELSNSKKKIEKNMMINVINMNIDNASKLLEQYNLKIEKEYEYNDAVDKNLIISQSIDKDLEINENDTLLLIISLGKLDKEKLKSDGIDELGKIPIMMYHGIKNISNSETSNIGGNVDKDGYTRTVEAFRNDLEKFYQEGYRMVKLSDYVNGNINTEYGYSPIILTFDDGNANNILVTGLDDMGEIIIDKNSAVGVMEEFKKKYPDYNVTAIFFVTNALFNQPEYNEKIMHWLIDHGYEIGNHTQGHNNFSNIDTSKTQQVVGFMYDKLESILGDKYSKIVALPFGSPYSRSHSNYKYIINGTYNNKSYETLAALRVGWEPEVSPFNKDFDRTFLKRCRAYDNNGREFDIEMILGMLKNTRYISDGNTQRIVTKKEKSDIISNNNDKELVLY